MKNKRIDSFMTSGGNWLFRAILPLPDFCQDILYHRILDKWLEKHPKIADAIIWDFPTGSVAYPQWPSDKKDQLRRPFPIRYPFALVDPPPNMINLADNEFPSTSLDEDSAWALYLNHVTQNLAVEFWNAVNWSMEDLPPGQLSILLDARAMFTRDASTGHYDIEMTEAGVATLAPPDLTYRFLVANDLIGETRVETIGRLLGWCRENLAHFLDGNEAKNMEYQWQYRGFPPISRILEGTPNNDPRPGYNDPNLRHRTAGCHGTNGFLKGVLRTVNIPVAYSRPPASGHATPYFPSEVKWMSHGDDPYNSFSKTTPRYPGEELLIDQTTYDSWFSASMPDPNLNVGRQVFELALVYLSDSMLHSHCADIAAGRTHAQSDVYAFFSRWYSVQELEARNLWERLDTKIATFGGCDYLP
jgi:hypothetical protein